MTRISDMTPLATLPVIGAFVPVEKTGSTSNYRYDLSSLAGQDALFVNAATFSVPAETDMVATTGYSVLGVGSAIYIYDAAVNGAYVIANPLTSFIDTSGRGFRLSLEQDITPGMLGATGLGVADDYPAFAATISLLPAIGGTISVLGGTYNLLTEPTWGTKVIRWNLSPDAIFTGAGTGAGKFPDTARPSFVMGRSVAIAGSKAKVDFVIDDSRALVENVGALWSSVIRIARAVGKVFVAADGAASAPQIASLSYAKNAGSPADVVSHMQVVEAGAANASVFGGNTVVFSSGGFNNCKLIGWEIDVQPQAATTPASAAGLIINAFTSTLPGPAIYFEGIFGGKWSTGINVGNLSDIGSGISPAAGNPRMGTLLDSGVANYQIGAIKLNNTHAIVFYNAAGSGAAAKRYCDSSNTLRDLLQPAGLLFRDAADANTYASVSSSGVLVVSGGVGYATGAGGTVTQATSRTTGVTLNKSCGSITLFSAAGTATYQTFTVTNSVVAATDSIRVIQKSGTDKNMIHVTAVAAGSFDITFATTGGTTTEQPVFNFAVVKAVAA